MTNASDFTRLLDLSDWRSRNDRGAARGGRDASASCGHHARRPDPIVELIQRGPASRSARRVRAHASARARPACMALLGSQADADEAMQETLLRAHRAMATLSRRGQRQGVAVRHRAPRLRARARDPPPRPRAARARARRMGEARDAFETRRRARAIRDALDQAEAQRARGARPALRRRPEPSRDRGGVRARRAAARKRISRALARLRTVLPAEEIE